MRIMTLLVVIFVCLLTACSVIVGIVIPLLLQLGQAVHQVIRGLVGDVREDPVHKWLVPLQLMLDGVTDNKFCLLSILL